MSDEQLKGYKELKKYREGKIFYDKKKSVLLASKRILCVIVAITLSFTCFLSSKVFTNSFISFSLFLGAYITPYFPIRFASKMKKKTNKKYFKKKYPFVNMKISDEKLERVLAFNDENNIKNIISNSINYKKNDSISTSEKIRRLKREKKVLENKYSNNSKPKTLKK
ncbi:MAG: hypothetical protein IKH54_03225 [Bacilli bacterium]|nr:hypothetical protein [Bacilli bacterium]